jgi:hypothetical protein
VIPVGGIELELVFRITVKGRTRDLAELMRTLEDAQVVILLVVKESATVSKNGNKGPIVSIGGFQT